MAVVWRILAFAVVVCLATTAFFASWAQLSAQSSSAPPAPIDWQHARTIQREAEAACLKSPTCPVDLARGYAQALAAEAPASSLPFSYLAISKVVAGEWEVAETLAREALRRSPRATLAHAIQADAASRRGDLATRLFHLDRMLELETPNQAAILASIADLAMSPAGLAVVRERIKQRPFWAGAVLGALIGRNINPQILLELTQGFPAAQDRLLLNLLEQRGPQAAFIGWIESSPPAAIEGLTWPIDPTFLGVDLRLPFNWALRTEGAEFERSGGLYVSYSGRGRQHFAEQVMMLGPGDFMLATEMAGELEPRSGFFAWTMRCLSSNTELTVLRVERLAPAPAKFASRFTVPATGCPAQRLTLFGLPGEFPQRGRTSVKSITIASQNEPRPRSPRGASSTATMQGPATSTPHASQPPPLPSAAKSPVAIGNQAGATTVAKDAPPTKSEKSADAENDGPPT